jgi:hypothetical protein
MIDNGPGSVKDDNGDDKDLPVLILETTLVWLQQWMREQRG